MRTLFLPSFQARGNHDQVMLSGGCIQEDVLRKGNATTRRRHKNKKNYNNNNINNNTTQHSTAHHTTR